MSLIDEEIVTRKSSSTAIRTVLSFTGVTGLAELDITDSIADNGIDWNQRTVGGNRIGASGHITQYDIPDAHVCTINLMPDTPGRLAMDLYIELTKPSEGFAAANGYISLTQTNTLTNKTSTYLYGNVQTDPDGDSFTREGGQSDRSYEIAFKQKVTM